MYLNDWRKEQEKPILEAAYTIFPGLRLTAAKHGVEIVFTDKDYWKTPIIGEVVHLQKHRHPHGNPQGQTIIIEMTCALWFDDDKPYVFVKENKVEAGTYVIVEYKGNANQSG